MGAGAAVDGDVSSRTGGGGGVGSGGDPGHERSGRMQKGTKQGSGKRRDHERGVRDSASGHSAGPHFRFNAEREFHPQVFKRYHSRASLVAQWLRICLPMQGTRVRALVWEDPTCHGATRPRESQLLSLRVWSLCSATKEVATVRGPRTAMKSGPRLPQLEKALAQKRRPNTAIS